MIHKACGTVLKKIQMKNYDLLHRIFSIVSISSTNKLYNSSPLVFFLDSGPFGCLTEILLAKLNFNLIRIFLQTVGFRFLKINIHVVFLKSFKSGVNIR